MTFGLQASEQELVEKAREAIKFLYGDKAIKQETFMFTPSGVGMAVEVEFTLTTDHKIRKDVTDVSTW